MATFAGSIVEDQLLMTRDGRFIVQAVVMSLIVVPSILYVYQRLYRVTGKPTRPVYSLKRAHHFFTGFFLVIGLFFVGLFISSSLGWLTIDQWHASQYWIGAFLFNMLIAFFYEALSEELALRGFVFDVLRHRFTVWFSVFIQTLLFVGVSIGFSVLQVIVGMVPLENIFIIPSMILLFFFGIALALMRIWTDSLWASIGFHLGYLEISRFLIMPTEYGAPPIMTFQDTITYGAGASFLIMFIILGASFILLILLGTKRMQKNK